MLAVDTAASTAQINASWKRLQKAVHPDVAGAYAETAAALLNEARAVLVRPIDRDAHDSDRANGSNEAAPIATCSLCSRRNR